MFSAVKIPDSLPSQHDRIHQQDTNKNNIEAKPANKRQLTKTIEYTRGGFFDAPDPRDKKALKRQKMNRIMLFNILAISIFFIPFYLMAFCINKLFNKPNIGEEEMPSKKDEEAGDGSRAINLKI